MDEHEVGAATAAGKSGDEERPLTLEERRRQFGEKLRATRLGLGQSDKDVIHLTRISPPFILALEEGRFDALPGEVFGRGFIKNICKALEVDSAALLADYDSCWDSKAPKAKTYMSGKRVARSRLRSERSGGGLKFVNYFSLKAVSLWIGLPIAFVASLVAIMIKWPLFTGGSPLSSSTGKETPAEVAAVKDEALQGASEEVPAVLQALAASEESDNAEEPVSTLSAGSDKPAAAEAAAVAAQAATPAAANPTPAKPKEAPLTLVNAQSEQSHLVVHVREKVEIKYKFDDKPAETQQHEPGNYEFAFKDKADVYVFDIAKVELEFNGRKLGWYGPQMGEKRLSFVGKDLKRSEL